MSLKGHAQYPFEKYPPIRYHKLTFNKTYLKRDSSFLAQSSYHNYKLIVTQRKDYDIIKVTIKYKNKVVSDFLVPPDNIMTLQDYAYVADIDGNGFLDFKVLFFNDGSGLAGSLEHKLYFFYEQNKSFKKIFYVDFFNFPERDINGDGNYEIISDNLIRYKGHSYWTFNLFNYINGKLIKVSRIADYPVMVQYLEDETFEITKKLSRKEMKKFTSTTPDYFKTRQ